MQSPAKTVDDYLQSLPEDRRAVIDAVRKVILENMDPKLEEGMNYGMIGYYVPLKHYPAGYHCDPKLPLPYACLAAQKNAFSLYAMTIYGHEPTLEWFTTAWKKSGKRLDMGKSCIRFKKLDDLPLDVIAQLFRKVSVNQYIKQTEEALASRKSAKGASAAEKAPAKKTPAKKAPAKKAPAKKQTGKTASVQHAAAKKPVVKKSVPKKGTANQALAKKGPVKKTSAKAAVAKKN